MVSVSIAIDFYDKFCLAAIKIDDVWPDGLLAAEFVSTDLAVAKGVPQFGFSRGLLFSLATGEFKFVLISSKFVFRC